MMALAISRGIQFCLMATLMMSFKLEINIGSPRILGLLHTHLEKLCRKFPTILNGALLVLELIVTQTTALQQYPFMVDFTIDFQ